MAITKSTDLTNSVTTVYEKKYYMVSMENPGVWGQFIDWQTPVSENGGSGSSLNFPIYGETDLVESALTEDADVTPDSITDGSVTVTPYEYGKTFAITKLARYQSRTNLDTIMGELVAKNRINSVDRILRRAACGRGATYPTMTMFPLAATTMATCDTASSLSNVSYAFLMQLAEAAASMGLEPFKGGGYVSIVHPKLYAEIKQLTEWKNLGYYAGEEDNIKGGLERPINLAGITFISSRMGRLYLGSGKLETSAGATTLSAAANKGATTIYVTANTGSKIVNGSILTLGTVETESVNPADNLEQVKVISGGTTTTLVVRGNGVGNDFGLRYNHAILDPVTPAGNVAAIPIIGKNSLIGVYGSDSKEYGIPKERDDLDTLDRIKYYGWYWYGGVGAIYKHLILGKVAVGSFTSGIYGWN